MRPEQALQQIAAAGLLPPIELTAAITTTCNLACQHCWIACLPGEGETRPVTVEAFRTLVADFAALGGEKLCLTGGEPLTHPHWQELAAFACRQRGLRQVTVQTNATLIDAETVKRLNDGDFAGLSFQVSLDGCSAATHDLIRGPGSLARAMHGLQALAEGGYGAKTTIAFTEMRHNFHEVPRLLEIAEQFGIASVVGLPLIRCGSAQDNPRTELPTPRQYLDLLEKFAGDPALCQRYQRLGTFAAVEWLRGAATSVHCGCRFVEKPYVTADGLIFPCALLQVADFAGRGVYQRSLPAAIIGALPLWADLQRLSQRRTTAMPCIDECVGGRHCGGGCLARAYLPDRNLTAREDRCALRRAVYAFGAPGKNGSG